jgi:hypothetical protein
MKVKGREVKVNMQRRHLELIAEVISQIGDIQVSQDTVATMFAASLAREQVNPNFDVCRFVKACKANKRIS